jgi:hypothetical protein
MEEKAGPGGGVVGVWEAGEGCGMAGGGEKGDALGMGVKVLGPI